jgi:hypothetical protein
MDIGGRNEKRLSAPSPSVATTYLSMNNKTPNITVGQTVTVSTKDSSFEGKVTALTTHGVYVADNNKKYRPDWRGEWFSFSAISIIPHREQSKNKNLNLIWLLPRG